MTNDEGVTEEAKSRTDSILISNGWVVVVVVVVVELNATISNASAAPWRQPRLNVQL